MTSHRPFNLHYCNQKSIVKSLVFGGFEKNECTRSMSIKNLNGFLHEVIFFFLSSNQRTFQSLCDVEKNIVFRPQKFNINNTFY